MAFFLLALTLFQFALRSLLHDTTLYFILNPYVLVMPFILIWLGAMIVDARKADRNLFLAWALLICFPAVMLRTFSGGFDFLLIFIRGVQFFWGPLLLIPGLLGLFRIVGYAEKTDDVARKYLTYVGIFAGALSLFELIAVYGLHVPPRSFPWVGNEGRSTENINPFRPWGLPGHPQANAVLLAYLFWLGYLHHVRSWIQKGVTALGTLLSLSGTGQIGFLALVPLVLRRPFGGAMIALLPLGALIAYSTATGQGAARGGFRVLQRFDLNYLAFLSTLFFRVTDTFFNGLTVTETMFGSELPNMDIVTGFTHDWAYLDVFLAYGSVGVLGYLLLYGMVLYLSCPADTSRSKRAFFILVVLALNFHYGALNFFVGQMIFSCLAAVRLNQMAATQSSGRRGPVSRPASTSA